MLAIALLNGFAAKTEARSIAIAISPAQSEIRAARRSPGPVLFSAPGDDRRARGRRAGRRRAGRSPRHCREKNAEGAPRYTSSIKRLLDTPDNAVLIRNNLLAQHDGNARIVTAGPATGMARLLGLFGARPQIQAKVERLVMTAGSFPAGPPDPAIAADVASARKIFSDWPTPIVVVGAEVGEALPYPGASIEKDFTWSQAHPGGRRVPRREADALRRAGAGAGRDAVCGQAGRDLFQGLGSRHDQRVG